MDLRPLGRTGLRVSPIGLGTVKLGRDRGLKYPSAAKIPTDEEALALLRAARELGINLIDTAPAYGSSEQRLGELLPRIAPREHWVISTKVGETFDPGTEASTYDFSDAAIRASVERSLLRLRVNSLDLVLLHFPSRDDIDLRTLQQGVAIGALCELQARGLVRHIGASVGSLAGGLHAVEVCDAVMVTLNAEDRTMLPIIEAARAKGVGVIVKKPLASGRADTDASLRLVCSTAGVSSAVVGTTNAAHLAQAVRAASGR